MTRVTFYDLPPADRLPFIARMAEAAHERGKRMLIHCGDPAVAEEIDEHLWVYRDETFLPHEIARPGEPLHDPEVGVVITTAEQDPISAEVLLLEAATSIEFARRYAAVIEIVDHRQPERLAESRVRFRRWRELGVEPEYRNEARRG